MIFLFYKEQLSISLMQEIPYTENLATYWNFVYVCHLNNNKVKITKETVNYGKFWLTNRKVEGEKRHIFIK